MSAVRTEQTTWFQTRPDLRVLASPVPIGFDVLAEAWQRAFDAAQSADCAVRAAPHAASPAGGERKLAAERQVTAELLSRAARAAGSRAAPWLSPTPVDGRMLGLPHGIRACLFDLDGVLIDSGSLHSWAWGEVLDPLLLRLSERAGLAFKPFDRVADYLAYLDGRPRLDGIDMFLASRGIQLPDGRSDDPAEAETTHGVARRKGEKLVQGLACRGVGALAGARRYLEAARRAGIRCAVVSASTTTLPMLELAELERLVDERADAELLASESLRARPAPDLLVAACRRLRVSSAEAATLTHSPAGVAAGRAAGLLVIGVGGGELGENLREFGAQRVVSTLVDLLDPRLRG